MNTDIQNLTDDQAIRALYSAKAELKKLPEIWVDNPEADKICDEYDRLWNECNRRGLLG